MKGIVFTEFLELVEEKFGLEMVDTIINNSNLPSKGVYTAIGTYSFSEMLSLLNNLKKETGIETDELLKIYGEHFFGLIKRSYPEFLAAYKDPITMLASIENHIHVEVRKIYPEAELPTFTILEQSKNHLVMLYKSSRSMHAFGHGLMIATFNYFNKKGTVHVEKLNEEATDVKFSITANEI